MGHTYGIDWNKERLGRLKSLCFSGYSNKEIGSILTREFNLEVSISSVENARHKNGILKHLVEIDASIKTYGELTLSEDDYMMSCDYHSPYHNEIWINRLLSIADLFKIKKNIIIGDLFDMDFAKKWYSDETSNIDKEVIQSNPVIKALSYFEKNYLVKGNHEGRIGRMTDGKIQAEHLFRLFGKDDWESRFVYTKYDKLRIGDKWLLVHPESYSQISPSVARRLAEKYHRNIINSHGHLVGMSHDRSGKYLAVDLGGMFDVRKIEYINTQTTTHPAWGCGFGMIRNGHFWHFTKATDWNYWGIE